MTNTYPPPPQPDGQHYNAAYLGHHGTSHLLDAAQQGQLQYSNLNQPMFPKLDSSPIPQDDPNMHMQNLAQELQNHAALGEQQRQQLQQTHQIQPPTSTANSPTALAATSHPQSQPGTPDHAPKTNRLRKACDSCSIRKVKCDENNPCKACSALDIPCTFQRPSRRRGPPNRHAEAIKRRRLEDGSGMEASQRTATSSPSSPLHAAQALTRLSTQIQSECTAESLCLPIETLNLLIDDFFAYIHPLCPFPHEPSFREQWAMREDRNNPGFLALLAAMIGALVASFPRMPRIHLQNQGRENVYSNHISLVKRCLEVCASARGPGYLDRDDLNVYDAGTSYFLALMNAFTYKWQAARLYFGESLTILRSLGSHKVQEGFSPTKDVPNPLRSQSTEAESSTEQPVNFINLEMSRRIYWTMVVTTRSLEQLGGRFGEIFIPPATRTDPWPPLPVEVDDSLIYPGYIGQQPEGKVPLIAGFNANVRIHNSYSNLATFEMAWGVDSLIDWERQQRMLFESLQTCKNLLADLPSVLTVQTQAGLRTPAVPQNGIYPPYQPDGRAALEGLPKTSAQFMPEDRRRSQYEIQKANVYVSNLATRSYIVEKYWNVREMYDRSISQNPGTPPDPSILNIATAVGHKTYASNKSEYNSTEIERVMRQERENIIRDLSIVLGSIDQVNMEPNAHSLTMKIRSIAGTLVQQGKPDQRGSALPSQAQAYLLAFLDILEKLERVSPGDGSEHSEQAGDEEADLRAWADLREYQMEFARNGGLLGLS